MPPSRKRARQLAAAAQRSAEVRTSLNTRVARNDVVLVPFCDHLAAEHRKLLASPDAKEALFTAVAQPEHRVFQAARVIGGRSSVGDGKRFNAPLSVLGGEPELHDAVSAALDAMQTAMTAAGVHDLRPCFPKSLLALAAGGLPQAAHADAQLGGALDVRLAGAAKALAQGRSVPEIPLTCIAALAEGATHLVSPYTRDEEVLLIDADPAARVYPSSKKTMVRHAIPPWMMAVIGQDTIHRGDTFSSNNAYTYIMSIQTSLPPTTRPGSFANLANWWTATSLFPANFQNTTCTEMLPS